MVVDDSSSLRRDVFGEVTGNYVPLVLDGQVFWMYWYDSSARDGNGRAVWGHDELDAIAQGFKVALTVQTQYEHGAKSYFSSLHTICLIGRN